MSDKFRPKVKAGSTFRFTLSLTEPSDIASFYPLGLAGVTMVGQVRTPSRALSYSIPMQNIVVGQTEVTINIPASVTRDWIPGDIMQADLLFSNGTDVGKDHSKTIAITVREPFTIEDRPNEATGSFGQSFGDSFKKPSS